MCLGLLRTVIIQNILIITYWWFSVVCIAHDAAWTVNEKEMVDLKTDLKNTYKMRF